jgi:CheY-like chemotaxis protein
MATILLVDDNHEYREVTREVLEMEGYTVLTAANGARAFDLMQQKKPDLVLTDATMPIMTGIELLQAIRADEQLKLIPIVLVTGRGSEDFLRSLRQLGADAILLKPVLMDKMLMLVRQLLQA